MDKVSRIFVRVVWVKLLLILLSVDLKGNAETVSLDGIWAATNANKSITVKGNVPGGIYTDLQNSGVIDDPYFRFNDVAYRWIAKDNWTYSRQFEVDQNILSKSVVRLRCEGLDTVSVIRVNGKNVGSSSNMFVAHTFDVKNVLQNGTNTIDVSFTSPILYAATQFQTYLKANDYGVPPLCPEPTQNGECHPNFIRKIQSQFSWDWGPAFPSMGIWKSISIEAVNEASIRDVTFSTTYTSTAEKGWTVEVETFFENVNENVEESGLVSVDFSGTTILRHAVKMKSDKKRESVFKTSFFLNENAFQIKRWWPNGYGAQTQYNLTLTYTTNSTTPARTSSKSIMVGFRTVELVHLLMLVRIKCVRGS